MRLREGVVVRVIGQLRAFNNSKSVVAYSIQPITNFNEYTFHFIDVVHTHLKATKGKPVGVGVPGGIMGGFPMNGGGMGGPAMQQGMAQAAPNVPTGGAPADVNNLVLSFFKTKGEASDMGCTIGDVVGAVSAQNISEQRVR